MLLSAGRRVLGWARTVRSKAALPGGTQHNSRHTWLRIGKCVCVGALALPVGLHLVSRGSIPRPLTALLSPAMADCTTTQPVLSDIVARADQLYEDNKMREGLSYLKQCKHLDEVEVLWRLARLCYKAGKYQTEEQEEKKRLAAEGWAYIERALAIGGDRHNGCRRWAGILLSWSSEFEGVKKKIEKSFEIRDHFLSAIECDAKDATSMHLLGQWCFSVVSVPWYQRQVASVFFATPPHSTYQEALSYFEAAEKADPGFYMVNWLWIGKCHLALGKKEEAQQWLKKTVSYNATLEEELEAKKEAEDLLKKL